MKELLKFRSIVRTLESGHNYFKDLNKNDQYVSSTNTKNMPKILVDFFDEYTVINTKPDLLCDASQYKDIELDYNKLKYLDMLEKKNRSTQ